MNYTDNQMISIVKNLPICFAAFDKNMNYISYSEKWLKDYKLDLNTTLVGKNHYEIFPEITDAWKDIHKRCLNGETISKKEDSFERLDGSIQYINWEVKPWYNQDNTVGGITITTEDVTSSVELKINNNELKEKEKKQYIEHKEIFLNAPNAYLVIDNVFNIIRFNTKAEEEFPLCKKTTTDISKLLSKSCFKSFEDYFKNLSNEHEPIIIKVKTNNSNIKNYKLTIVPYSTNINEYLLSFVDIENELLIVEQSKMALMGEMVANIIHQWKQPLNAISMNATELIFYKRNNIERTNEFDVDSLEKIQIQLKYLANTIDVFANFIRSDKEINDISFQNIIKNSIEIIKPNLKSNYIKYELNILENELIIKSVPGELEQVIINIINNAKDAILENEIKSPLIEISLESNGDKAILIIEDNAGGIPEKVLPRIFQPYFSTKKEKHGMGLGLHMSAKIVKNTLNGNIRVENSEKGAKFYLEIPISK